jgi:hypothetical protein
MSAECLKVDHGQVSFFGPCSKVVVAEDRGLAWTGPGSDQKLMLALKFLHVTTTTVAPVEVNFRFAIEVHQPEQLNCSGSISITLQTIRCNAVYDVMSPSVVSYVHKRGILPLPFS